MTADQCSEPVNEFERLVDAAWYRHERGRARVEAWAQLRKDREEA